MAPVLGLGAVPPILGLLQWRNDAWVLGAARRARPIPADPAVGDVDAAAPYRTFWDFSSRPTAPKQLTCRVCARQLTVKPSKLGRGLDPQTHPGAAPDIYI